MKSQKTAFDTTNLSLSQQIYERLRLSLMAGRYPPGSRLNISRLAQEFGVSATPVREAVVQLVREQALELRRGHQARVPVPEIAHYIQVRETRVPLERLAAELATTHITDEGIDELEALHRSYVTCEEREDWLGALAANQSFHFRIYEASANPVLKSVLENFWLIAGPFITNQYPALRNAHTDPHPHNSLIEALRRRSAPEAGDALVRDLRDGSYHVVAWLKANKLRADGTVAKE
ncbi:GntR family transcriptional regulator [uncultured Roseibium sp.]|uniref:GntR family transcriptional regulator n=1 Tax=uncultured Roseibium sp. TaxID=1936171 RepID=UPI003216A9D1